MEYKYINVDKINIGDVNINKDKNIIIPILYDDSELSIKIPNTKNKYFEVNQIENIIFNYCLTLELMEDMDEIEEEYKNNHEDLFNQKELIKFSDFIFEIKNKIIESFFNKLKINKNYLDIINFNDLDLEYHEIDKAIWNENIDFSYIPEIKEIEDNYILKEKYDIKDNDKIEINLRHIFHLNKFTEKNNNLILKSDIVFINKKLKDKKHIYINWYII